MLQIINPVTEKRVRGRSNRSKNTVMNGIAPVLPSVKKTGTKMPLWNAKGKDAIPAPSMTQAFLEGFQ